MAHRSPDLIPFEPVRRVIENWLRTTTVPDPAMAATRLIWPEADDKKGSRLAKMMAQQENITFDLADLILARLNLTHLWLEDPELRAVYESVDFTWLDVAKPTCPEVDGANRRRVAEAHERNFGFITYTAIDLGLPVPQVRRLLAAA